MAFTVPDNFTVNMTYLGALALTMVSVCGVMWVIRKLTKTINRS